MTFKKLAICMLIAAVMIGAVSCKKNTPASERSEQKNNKSADINVTEENFRDFPVSDESIFGFDVVDGGLEIGGCKKDVADKVIVVPETINGKRVVSIGFGAFSQLENVEAILVTLSDILIF